jgi:membrane protein implicated in regulation of membrane protease activity
VTVDLQAWLRWGATFGAWLVGGFAALAGLFFLFVRIVARPQPPLTGSLVGATGVALTEVSGAEGRVRIGGVELRAIAEARIAVGSAVRVVEVDGLVAKVAPAV